MEIMPMKMDEQPICSKPDLIADSYEMLGGDRLAYSSESDLEDGPPDLIGSLPGSDLLMIAIL